MQISRAELLPFSVRMLQQPVYVNSLIKRDGLFLIDEYQLENEDTGLAFAERASILSP